MDCPACRTPLRPYEKSGVEIDVCPSCRGVWLDRGELERLLVAEARYGAPHGDPYSHGRDHDQHDKHREDHHGHGHSEHHGSERHPEGHGHEDRYGQHGRRRSFLSELLGGLGGDD